MKATFTGSASHGDHRHRDSVHKEFPLSASIILLGLQPTCPFGFLFFPWHLELGAPGFDDQRLIAPAIKERISERTLVDSLVQYSLVKDANHQQSSMPYGSTRGSF